MTAEDQLRASLAQMDIPTYKLDIEKPTTVKWLLLHLRDRNAKSPLYRTLMQELLVLAKSKNWLKKNEVLQLESHLDLDIMFGQTKTGRFSYTDLNESNVPKPGIREVDATRAPLVPSRGPRIFRTVTKHS